MIWEVFFNRPIQEDSYSLTEILINLQEPRFRQGGSSKYVLFRNVSLL